MKICQTCDSKHQMQFIKDNINEWYVQEWLVLTGKLPLFGTLFDFLQGPDNAFPPVKFLWFGHIKSEKQ